VLAGRDHTGTGKIFAHIPYPYGRPNGHTICECRSWGYEEGKTQWLPFYGVDFGSMEKCSDAAIKKYEAGFNVPVFALKVIPDGVGGYDVFAPYQYAFVWDFKECWEGKAAEFYMNDQMDGSLIIEKRSVAALKTLPVREIITTLHFYADIGQSRSVYGKLK
jgi:hypothetical protein